MCIKLGFLRIWVLDFEFRALPGERPQPHCLVAHDLVTGQVIRVWLDWDQIPKQPPFDVGNTSLFIAYFSSAEWGCFLALGWPLPMHVVDLYVEFRRATNGCPPAFGNGLLGALRHFGLPTIDAEEKIAMRELAIRGGPYSDHERSALLAYCESDVRATALLVHRLLPITDIPLALIRGRYMKAVARMEHLGIPIDVAILEALRTHWHSIKKTLCDKVNSKLPVFVDGHFNYKRFERLLTDRNLRWPRTESGRLAVDGDTFRDMAHVYPMMLPFQQVLQVLGKLRLIDLAVGTDGRNRTLLSPFSSKTSRNQPSTSHYIFGSAAWLRGLIKPGRGCALAYIDYSQQEFAIGAALSRDPAMMDAYLSGDPYLGFAKQAGAVPASGTKDSHKNERNQFKACVLGAQFGMQEHTLADRIGQSPAHARLLLEAHRATYGKYWEWTQAAVDYAMLHGYIDTVMGWRQRVGPDANARSLQNFPCQSNGAEMLRLACIFATERDVTVCAPVHDALLIEADESEIETKVALAQAAMADASRVILGGFELRSDAKVIRWPDRYDDERGREVWEAVMAILDDEVEK